MAISLPLICCISFSDAASKFTALPSFFVNRISPLGYCAGGAGNKRSTESEVMDLPEPLSPTTATTSPLLMVKEIPCTAF